MKNVPSALFFVLLALVPTATEAQRCYATEALECPPGEGNVRSRVLHSDSLSSSFLLCIATEVKPHLHRFHTEHVQVLEGEAVMLLGDSTFTVRPGSFITIPSGTPHAARVSGSTPLRVISVQSPFFDGSDRVAVDPGVFR